MPESNVFNGQQFHELAKSDEQPSEEAILRKEFTPDSIEKSEHEERKVKFNISTESPDRDNDTISTKGWDLSAYKKNPVVLFAHDARTPPIAKASNVTVNDNVLQAEAEFMPREMSEFADSVYQMIQNDFLRATSVGFRPLEFKINEERGGIDFEKQELMEFSIVPVPANPEALIEARSKGIDVNPYKDWLESALDYWLEYEDLLVLPRKDVEKFYFASKGDDPSKARSRRRLKLVNDEGEEYEPKYEDNGTKDEEVSQEEDKQVESEEEKETIETEEVSSDETKSEEVEEKKMTISFSRAHQGGTPKAGKDREWDGPGEVASANVEDLWVMATWVAELDEDEEEHDKGDFKLPHHVAESKHPVVWRGVVAAMASLMGARGGVDVPEADRRGIYDHLAKHYQEFDEEPPSFEAAEDQILAKEQWSMDYETGHPVKVEGGEVKYFEPKETDEVTQLRQEIQELKDTVDSLKGVIQGFTEQQVQESEQVEESEDKQPNSTESVEQEAGIDENVEDKSDELEIDEEQLLAALPDVIAEVAAEEAAKQTNEIFGKVSTQ